MSLRGLTAAVAEAAAPMPYRLWLCPNTAENREKLACYPNTTERILSALVSDAARAKAEELRASNTVFCAAGDVVLLGPDGVRDARELAD